MEKLPEDLTYKKAFDQLEAIVEKLEKGGVELEEAMKLYKTGTQLLAYCSQLLEQTEQKIKRTAEDETLDL